MIQRPGGTILAAGQSARPVIAVSGSAIGPVWFRSNPPIEQLSKTPEWARGGRGPRRVFQDLPALGRKSARAKKAEISRDSGQDRKAGEGTRTLDIQLGKLALYQLSYARERTRSKPACHSNRPRKCNYRHSKPIRNPCRFRRRDGHYRDDTEPQQNLAPPKNPGTFPRPRTVRGNFGDPDDLFGRCIFHDDWLGDFYRARMFRKHDSRPARRRRD